MEKPTGNLGAVIYYLDFDKDQWRKGVRHLLPDAIRYEAHPHITILYGLHHHHLNLTQLQAVLANFTKDEYISVTPEEISVFSNENDVVYLNVTSHQITELHRAIRDAFKHTITHNTFTPHITLAFARPGSADHLGGLCLPPESLGLTQPITGAFFYLTPDKKRILL